MNPKFLSVMTLALLVILVAFPLAFILLQAVFPQFSAGARYRLGLVWLW